MDLMQRRRQLMGMQNNERNLFSIDKLWDEANEIGTNEQFYYLGIAVPNGYYEVSTNVIDNTNPSIASVLAQTNLAVPGSSYAGVFVNRPRTINVFNSLLYVYIRTASGSYLTWTRETFAPYYIKVIKA